MTTDPAQGESHSTHADPSAPAPLQPSTVSVIFLGPNGIRSGWRLLLFMLFFVAAGFVLGKVLRHITWVINHVIAPLSANNLTARAAIFNEAFLFVSLMIAVSIMKLIEKKSFAGYGVPGRGFLGTKFWLGVPYGFALLSLLLVGIASLHGFTLGPVSLNSHDALKYGLLYGIAFLLVGLTEEIWFRGYMQATLTEGIGFWWAAIVLSIVFGAIHLGNTGEAIFGAVTAGSFGIVAAFSLQRTGNLWFAIGMHAGWDWAETYFYGVPDSGLVASGHLYSASFHGAKWLTGGTVGPEGSYFCLLILILGAIGIHFLFPTKKDSIKAAA